MLLKIVISGKASDVDNPKGKRWPLLFFAVFNGHKGTVILLSENGAAVNKTDAEGNTALHLAAFSGQDEILQHLLNYGAKVNAQNKYNITPLHLAALNGHRSSVNILLSRNADASIKDAAKCTPLMAAAFKGFKSIVEDFIEHGITTSDINHALFVAVQSNRRDVAEFLVSRGADVNFEIETEVIKDNKIKMRSEDDDEKHTLVKVYTVLHLAVQCGHTDIVEMLLRNGAQKDTDLKVIKKKYGGMCDSYCFTTLHCAVMAGHKDVVRLLLDGSCDTGARNYQEETPLHIAANQGLYFYNLIRRMIVSSFLSLVIKHSTLVLNWLFDFVHVLLISVDLILFLS